MLWSYFKGDNARQLGLLFSCSTCEILFVCFVRMIPWTCLAPCLTIEVSPSKSERSASYCIGQQVLFRKIWQCLICMEGFFSMQDDTESDSFLSPPWHGWLTFTWIGVGGWGEPLPMSCHLSKQMLNRTIPYGFHAAAVPKASSFVATAGLKEPCPPSVAFFSGDVLVLLFTR